MKKTTSDTRVDGWIILERVLKKYSVDWIQLAQDRIQWRAFVNTIMNRRVS